MPDGEGGSIGVVMIDDQQIVLAGVAGIVQRQPDMHVSGTARGLEAAVALIEQTSPDVVVTDMQIGDESGLALLDRFADGRPAIIVLSSFEHSTYYQAALQRGAAGYVLKGAAVDELIDAIRVVAAGGISFPAHILRSGRHAAGRPPSRRELEIIHLVCEGSSNEEIGTELAISPKTVDSHLRGLFDRYGVVSRTELAMLAVAEGWLRPSVGGVPPDQHGKQRRRWIADAKIVRSR